MTPDLFRRMADDLDSHALEVILTPQRRFTNEGGMIRTVAGQNVPWYRRLCAESPSGRGVRRGKFDTGVRRQNVRRVLERLACGKPSRSLYVVKLSELSEMVANPEKSKRGTTMKLYGK